MRKCSVLGNVETRASPEERATMRAKLVHGTNSINWAKSVLPRFIGNPQNYRSRETTNKWRIEIQIGTKINRPQTLVVIGFASKPGCVDRTLLMKNLKTQVGVAEFVEFIDHKGMLQSD